MQQAKRYPRGTHWRDLVIEDENKCLIWQGTVDPDGYGRRSRQHSAGVLAHRQVYWDEVGAIPDGLTLDHLCRTRACVNPAHLEPVTVGENVLRGNTFQGINARKTHCLRGHEFTSENTATGRTREGTPTRVCKTCNARRQRLHRLADTGGEG